MTPRYDLAALRAAVPISRLLTADGIDVSTRGRRMRCPIHRGDNSTVFTFDHVGFRCFVCDARGDVFDLACTLHKLTFPQAVEHVARIAGISATQFPTPTRDEITHRAAMARRRAGLFARREDRLNSLAVQLNALDRAADAAGAALTDACGTDRESAAWDALDEVHTRRDSAEYERCRLESDREQDWLDVLMRKVEVMGWAA